MISATPQDIIVPAKNPFSDLSFFGTPFRTYVSRSVLLAYPYDSAASKVQYCTFGCLVSVDNLTLAIGYGLVAFSLHRFDDIEMTPLSIYTIGFTHFEGPI